MDNSHDELRPWMVPSYHNCPAPPCGPPYIIPEVDDTQPGPRFELFPEPPACQHFSGRPQDCFQTGEHNASNQGAVGSRFMTTARSSVEEQSKASIMNVDLYLPADSNRLGCVGGYRAHSLDQLKAEYRARGKSLPEGDGHEELAEGLYDDDLEYAERRQQERDVSKDEEAPSSQKSRPEDDHLEKGDIPESANSTSWDGDLDHLPDQNGDQDMFFMNKWGY